MNDQLGGEGAPQNSTIVTAQEQTVIVKSLSTESRTAVNVFARDLEHIASELRSVRKPRRWPLILGSILIGVSIACIGAGVAGIVHHSAPIPLRVAYFVIGVLTGSFAIVCYAMSSNEAEDPQSVCVKVIARMIQLDLISPVHGQPPRGGWMARRLHNAGHSACPAETSEDTENVTP
jgi:hypothetical protein